MSDHRIKWKLIRDLPSKNGMVHIARLTNESSIIPLDRHDKYVIKILDSDHGDRINNNTIKLNIKLSLMGIVPSVLDYNDHSNESMNQKSMYFVNKLYMVNGSEYLVMLNQLYDDYCHTQPLGSIGINKHRLNKLYRAYMTRLIVLYNQLARVGVCSFDTKNENIVVNYNQQFVITDMRLIDIDYNRLMIIKNPPELTIRVFYTAMLLMNFTVASLYTYHNKQRLLGFYRIIFNTAIIGIYSLDIDDIKSDKIFDEFKKLIPHTKYNITWRSMMWCYWNKHSDIDTFTDCTEVEQDFMFERILSEIIKMLV